MSDKMVMRGGVQDFQTYYEIKVPWQEGNGSAPFLVNSGGWRFSPADLGGSDDETIIASEEQYTKLQYYFNMYEQFKLCKVVIKYVPRWTQLIPIYIGEATVGGAQLNFVQAGSPDVPLNYGTSAAGVASFVPSFMNNKEIFMISDYEDIITRAGVTAGAIDELYQARLQNGLRRCHQTQTCEIEILPHYTDVIQGVATENEPASNPISVLPKPTEWFTTKVVNTGAGNTVVLNLLQEFFGFKWWVYDPYNTSQFNTTFNIGKFEATYFWTFRFLDNRALVSLVTITEPNEERAKKRRLELLKHPGGQVMSAHQHRGSLQKTQLSTLAKVVARERLLESAPPAVDPRQTTPLSRQPPQSSAPTPLSRRA
uniref:Capsid protein n=1 Tax=Muscicapa latirostris CRESS-DNA-virus sp. TaxID=2815046 RepID=A0A8A4XCG8_9VIRU|nr:MAG: hypothetical protein [Muscicapa latirostris CRESS-DNA-virus sp.]